MIKKLAVFKKHAALNSQEPLDAMLQAARHRGWEICHDSHDADAVIIWSVLWRGRMAPNREIYDSYRRRHRPVIVVDVGTLQRNVTWKVAVDHITAGGYYGQYHDIDETRAERLGIKLENIPARREEILIAAQHSHSLQVQTLPGGQETWILNVIQQLRKFTTRPMILRPHPRSPRLTMSLPTGVSVQHPKKIANTYDDFDITYDYHAVINATSGPGIQAALAGCRPITHAGSLAHPVSIKLADIEKPYTVDRTRWLHQIAHTEYTVPELAAGLWIDRLAAALER